MALSDAAQLPVPPSDIAGPGATRLIVTMLGQLHTTLDLIYHQVLSPPSLLQTFQTATATLLRETEAERMRVERIGQDLFRTRLLQIWHRTCPLTGISDTALLRASHIIPWAAAFDRGLVTFTDDGAPLFHQALSPAARAQLIHTASLALSAAQKTRMKFHRKKIFGVQTAL